VSLSTVAVTNPAPDTKGWIGERFDADAGLQYLNARYYDPQLGMFLQPDWWEVVRAGVGTNRYSYSFGDPVNGIDPSGHNADPALDPNYLDPVYNPPVFTGRTYWQDMSDVCSAGGCAIVAVALSGGFAVVAGAEVGAMSAAAKFALLNDDILAASDGVPISGGKGTQRGLTELQVGTYSALTKSRVAGDGFHIDHIPSTAANVARAQTQSIVTTGRRLTPAQLNKVKQDGMGVVVPAEVHTSLSRTYGGRNSARVIKADTLDPKGAVQRDTDRYRGRYGNDLIDRVHAALQGDQGRR
jgi:RHS repeat-associated protein